MSLLDELHAAAFKGVDFYMLESSASGGRKDIVHSFPNSDEQAIEDLGLAPKIFSITALISGVDYFTKRNAFLAVLDDPKPGVLSHPWYGQIENYVARNYTIVEDLTSLGEAKFNIVFEAATTNAIPVKSKSTVSVINSSKESVLSALVGEFTETWDVSLKFIGNFQDALQKVGESPEYFSAASKQAPIDSGDYDDFNQQLNYLTNNIPFLISDGTLLASTVQNLFLSLNSLFSDPASTAHIMEGFFTFGDSDTAINATTVGLQVRDDTRKLFNATIQTSALTYAYFSTSQIIFETVDAIELQANRLESQFQKLIVASGLGESVKDALKNLRSQMQTFFDEQRLNARQIIDVFTSLTSARLLSYRYYADSSQAEQLITLNNFDNASFIDGIVKVLTE